MKNQGNNYAFIDSQNLYRGIKAQGWFIDWIRFRKYLTEKYSITTAYLFVGYIPEHNDLYDSLQKAGTNIIQTGYVTDGQRAALFETASIFVLPSLYEGFGMTLLEAMSYDVPVIASDIAIFREVCGDAALYFDSASPHQLAQQLKNLLSDARLQSKLIAGGKTNLKRFSWQQNTNKIYKRIGASK